MYRPRAGNAYTRHYACTRSSSTRTITPSALEPRVRISPAPETSYTRPRERAVLR